MKDLKFVVEPWKDIDGRETEAIYIDTDGLYTVSEFIVLLEKAREKWGDKQVVIHDFNSNIIGGFGTVYLHHGFDYREEYGEDYYEDDQICIFG